MILAGGQLLAVALDTGQIFALAIAAAVGAIVVGIVALLVLRGRGRSTDLARREDAIRRDGILGRGTVLGVSPTGRHRGERDEIDLRLEVQLPMRRRFEVRRRDWLDADERGRLAVGAAIPVAADPNELGHVVLVLDIPEVDPAAIAGLGPVAGGPGGPPRGVRPVRPPREERDTDR